MTIQTDESRVQGEGDHEAARRYDQSARAFVAANDWRAAGKRAAPGDAQEAADMLAAEREGRSRSKGEASGDSNFAAPSPVAGDVDRARLWDLVKDIRFAMFTTRHANGHLHSRPMTTQNSALDEDASLWFYMSRKGDPVGDLSAEPVVGITYSDPGADRYVSVSGTASVVEDMVRKRQFWSKLAQAWFPGGVDDPDLALVQVKIVHAEYWDVKESKLVQLFRMAKAAVTGQPPRDLGEHGEIRLR